MLLLKSKPECDAGHGAVASLLEVADSRRVAGQRDPETIDFVSPPVGGRAKKTVSGTDLPHDAQRIPAPDTTKSITAEPASHSNNETYLSHDYYSD